MLINYVREHKVEQENKYVFSGSEGDGDLHIFTLRGRGRVGGHRHVRHCLHHVVKDYIREQKQGTNETN